MNVDYLGTMPYYGTPGAAGGDLRFSEEEEWTLRPFERKKIPTDCRLAIPEGCVGLVCPRSGLADKHGISVLNGPGIIDPDYRGEIKVLLINLSDGIFTIKPDMKIAQLVIVPCIRAAYNPVVQLDYTERGSGGFGSTGS